MAVPEWRGVDWPRQCAAVIPCLNEARAASEVVAGVRQHVPSVFVVDDGSTDDTAARTAGVGATVIRHASNQGKGAALRTGLGHARKQGFSWSLTLDGDGQHAPGDIPSFFACAEQTRASLVIGDRLGSPGDMPWLRRVVNRWMTARLSRLTGLALADSQCGFRLICLAAWEKLPLKTDHYETESELLVEFARAGHRVEFIPVQVIYKPGGSKVRSFADIWHWLRWWFAQR